MKTKALISFAVTAKLICVSFVAYAKIRFSHDDARIDLHWTGRLRMDTVMLGTTLTLMCIVLLAFSIMPMFSDPKVTKFISDFSPCLTLTTLLMLLPFMFYDLMYLRAF